MAVKTPLRIVTRKIGDAIGTFATGEGMARDDFAIGGEFDEPTERFYLIVGSSLPIDERRWHSGIMKAIREEFADSPGITSSLVLVVRNVTRIEDIYQDMGIGDGGIDVTQWF